MTRRIFIHPTITFGTSGVLAILILATMLSGCAGVDKGRPQRVAYEDKIVGALVDKYSRPDAIPTNQQGMTVEQRNQVLEDLIYLTDVNFYKFTAGLYKGRAYFDTATDLAILGLGAGGALTPAASTKAILAAISGGIGGSRVSIDKNFFREQSVQALIAKMTSARQSKLATMREGMANLQVSQYPLSRGLADLAGYYNAGTIVGALEDIVATAGVEKADANKKIERTLTASFGADANTALLRTFWKPDGKTISADNEKELKKWMKDNELDEVSIPFFLKSTDFADKRSKAVKELPIPK